MCFGVIPAVVLNEHLPHHRHPCCQELPAGCDWSHANLEGLAAKLRVVTLAGMFTPTDLGVSFSTRPCRTTAEMYRAKWANSR